ncbi:MAG: molecular chaperone DnaJ [Myxococcota bacterium]
MATRDFYNVLGISRDASSEDVKRAYRALARRWHPDRNPDDAGADRRFRDITEAFRTLSDPERRARYDRLGPLYTEDGRPPRPEEVGEVLGGVWRNLFKRRGRERGEDLRYTISLELEDVAAGGEREIVVPRRVRCRTCTGDGADPDGGKKTCPVCKGSGKPSGARLFRTECYHCDGRGYNIERRCPTCDAEGRITLDDPIRVKIPGGVATGQKLKLAGKGNAPRGAGPPGDLFVIVNVAEHPLFLRRGEDVVVELPLSFDELALGADVPVPTLEGRTTIRVPAGSVPGKVLRLAGRGLPRVGRSLRGDLHLQLQLEVPTDLDAAARQSLTEWASQLAPTQHPRRLAFDEAVRTRDG